MIQRGKRFWVKLLVGVAYGILVVDVLVLAVLVAPLRASPQVSTDALADHERPSETFADQVLVLPTHDPSKPWPTRTPLPTPTPWLVAVVRLAAQRQAELESARSAAQAHANPSGIAPTPEPAGASIQTATTPTNAVALADNSSNGGGAQKAQIQPAGTAARSQLEASPAGTPSPTPEAPSSAEPSGTATPTAPAPAESQETPTDAPGPTLTPATPEPSPAKTQGDEAQFTAYVEGHYNTIADQPLEITGVTFAHPDSGIPLVTVELSGGVWNNVFAAQAVDVIADYGGRLLNDTKSYFNGQSCSVNVVSRYETSDPDGCTSIPSWCYLGGYNQASQAWSVVWTYVIGTSTDGTDSVQTWNAVRENGFAAGRGKVFGMLNSDDLILSFRSLHKISHG